MSDQALPSGHTFGDIGRTPPRRLSACPMQFVSNAVIVDIFALLISAMTAQPHSVHAIRICIGKETYWKREKIEMTATTKITSIPKTKYVTVPKIIETGSIGPFRINMDLVDIANTVGAPDYWHFAPGPGVEFYAGFGPLEVYVRDKNQKLIIYFIKLNVYKFISKSRYNFWQEKIEYRIGKRWRNYESARNLIENMTIEYSSEFNELVHPGTAAVYNLPGGVRLYYTASSDGCDLSSIELS